MLTLAEMEGTGYMADEEGAAQEARQRRAKATVLVLERSERRRRLETQCNAVTRRARSLGVVTGVVVPREHFCAELEQEAGLSIRN